MSHDKAKKRRQLKPVTLEDINNHIRVIRDPKLKLSYQTMLATGLRVSELGQIAPGDCLISPTTIELHFIGKGGNNEDVTIANKQMVRKLTSLIQGTKQEDKVFYSPGYLQSKANSMGFQCIDLRRAFAKLTYRETKSLATVKERMRHVRARNTKIYLNSKVKV